MPAKELEGLRGARRDVERFEKLTKKLKDKVKKVQDKFEARKDLLKRANPLTPFDLAVGEREDSGADAALLTESSQPVGAVSRTAQSHSSVA